jgi:hypothetical protein
VVFEVVLPLLLLLAGAAAAVAARDALAIAALLAKGLLSAM